MKNCTDCKYAEWKRTASGRLHPSREGRCKFPYKVPPLPASMVWTWNTAPRPVGGDIYRNKEHCDHCPYYQEG
jgi:hypothetical protein